MTKPLLKKLEPGFSVEDFDCGNTMVNEFLKHKALDQQERRYTTVYAICLDNRVIAYSAVMCSHLYIPLPDDKEQSFRVPGILLGKLAVDEKYMEKGLGTKLIEHCISLAHKIAKSAACRIIWIEAYDDKVGYYGKKKFIYVDKVSENRNRMYYDLVKTAPTVSPR